MARHIPNYALYGDQAEPAWSNSFNFEWIPQRSAVYQWTIHVHRHDAFLQLLYLTHGSAMVSLDEARFQAVAPALIVVPAGHAHGFQFAPDVDGAVVTATQKVLESVAGLLMPDLLPWLRAARVSNLPNRPPQPDSLTPLFLALEQESRTHAPGQTAAGMALLTALLVRLSRIDRPVPTGDSPTPAAPQGRKHRQIEQFRSLLDQHHRTHWPVQRYADTLGLTAGQLTRVCKDALGMSALDVINARLVHEAQRELVYTVSSVKLVAHELGFQDEAYFSRFFKRHTGLTPLAFKSQALAQLNSQHNPSERPTP